MELGLFRFHHRQLLYSIQLCGSILLLTKTQDILTMSGPSLMIKTLSFTVTRGVSKVNYLVCNMLHIVHSSIVRSNSPLV